MAGPICLTKIDFVLGLWEMDSLVRVDLLRCPPFLGVAVELDVSLGKFQAYCFVA